MSILLLQNCDFDFSFSFWLKAITEAIPNVNGYVFFFFFLDAFLNAADLDAIVLDAICFLEPVSPNLKKKDC